jgi:DNA-binding LytR/AlgR family response regulator
MRMSREAAEAIAREQPSVAFLDIRMPGLSGLEVAQGIEGPTRVVFITAYDEFALQAFEQAALDYVLKPVRRERLGRTVQRLRQALAAPAAAQAQGQADADEALAATLRRLLADPAAAQAAAEPLRWIRAGAGDVVHQIPVESVLYFHADEKYTVVQTAQAEHLIRTPIVELAAQLDTRQFRQIHRSTIVNLAQVAGTRRDETSRLYVRLHQHPRELPVSRAYVHLFRSM